MYAPSCQSKFLVCANFHGEKPFLILKLVRPAKEVVGRGIIITRKYISCRKCIGMLKDEMNKKKLF